MFITTLLLCSMLVTGLYKSRMRDPARNKGEEKKKFPWEHYPT
jgi:hypothetical protein